MCGQYIRIVWLWKENPHSVHSLWLQSIPMKSIYVRQVTCLWRCCAHSIKAKHLNYSKGCAPHRKHQTTDQSFVIFVFFWIFLNAWVCILHKVRLSIDIACSLKKKHTTAYTPVSTHLIWKYHCSPAYTSPMNVYKQLNLTQAFVGLTLSTVVPDWHM